MKALDLNLMTEINGGGLISAACTGFTIGSVVVGVGVLLNWWNPAGWVGAAMLAVDAGCLIYNAKH